MRVFAPGKLVLTGAYAVLEGAPAIVVATNRGAYADSARVALSATPEVRALLGEEAAPHVDASALFVGARKLGLGASAAILVASAAAREAEKGADLSDSRVRDAIFARARAAHAEAQSGGSGIDVAASVYGGVLRYTTTSVTPASLPARFHMTVLACATSARTSDLRAEVERLARANPALHRSCLTELARIAESAADAVASNDAARLVVDIGRAGLALANLGEASGAPIVPAGIAELAALATAEDGALCVSGAGGGDVAVYGGLAAPSRAFLARAHALGLFVVDLHLDEKGVRLAPEHTASVVTDLDAR